MLTELTVRDLGVIEELTLVLGPGLTALTGETGAGKTLVVEAIELLVGGRADGVLVRPGASEAWVEGRFVAAGGEEVILARAVPAEGRSRAYVDGRMATIASLADWGAQLIDLHGQHEHQSLLRPAVQRAALDAYAGVDLGPLDAARARLRQIGDAIAALGGDERTRAREMDLLRFQVAEFEAARIDDPDEESLLEREEGILAQSEAWRDAASVAHEALEGDAGAGERLGSALGALRGRSGGPGPFDDIADRLAVAATEIRDAAADLRATAETIADDPERLGSIQGRRHALRDLRRKYGDTLADVLAYAEGARTRLAELESFDARGAKLEQDRQAAEAAVGRAAAEVARVRGSAAPELGAAIEAHLQDLALPRARLAVTVGGQPPADAVEFGLGANPGEAVLPLAKVASGGELARAMLAVRLVLSAGPPTLVFDEVDAGIGGEAAVGVGRALARLGGETGRQVIVVTHLAQVAAFAATQVAVDKRTVGDRTVATAAVVRAEDRVRELSRMLSGRPDSSSAREHAAELLEAAAAEVAAAGAARTRRRPRT